jgi:Fe-S-cluster-containing dehydrogenase component
MKQLALIIDHEACWGCLACEVACKQENNADPGIKFIRVTEEAVREKSGKPFFSFNVNVCRHSECEGTPCVDVCPTDAITVRGDGIVVMDTNDCTGCNLCPRACPYDAIVINENASVTQKCNLCYHRVDNGLMPACADNVCLAHCIYFGDPRDARPRIESRRMVRERL